MRRAIWNERGGRTRYPVSLALGAFDAIHLGHQKLLKTETGLPMQAAYFNPAPQAIFDKHFLGMVRTLEQREQIFKQLRLNGILRIDFSSEFSKIEGDDFMNELYKRVNMKVLVVGSNFRLGRRRSYGLKELEHWLKVRGIALRTAPVDDGISSDRLRKLIKTGMVGEAQKLLGYPFALDLRGLPSKKTHACIEYDLSKSVQVLPPDGQYAFGLIAGKKLIAKSKIKEAAF